MSPFRRYCWDRECTDRLSRAECVQIASTTTFNGGGSGCFLAANKMLCAKTCSETWPNTMNQIDCARPGLCAEVVAATEAYNDDNSLPLDGTCMKADLLRMCAFSCAERWPNMLHEYETGQACIREPPSCTESDASNCMFPSGITDCAQCSVRDVIAGCQPQCQRVCGAHGLRHTGAAPGFLNWCQLAPSPWCEADLPTFNCEQIVAQTENGGGCRNPNYFERCQMSCAEAFPGDYDDVCVVPPTPCAADSGGWCPVIVAATSGPTTTGGCRSPAFGGCQTSCALAFPGEAWRQAPKSGLT